MNPGGAEVGAIPHHQCPLLKAETLTPANSRPKSLLACFVFRVIIWTKKAPVMVGFAITRMELWVLTPEQAPGLWWRGRWCCCCVACTQNHTVVS